MDPITQTILAFFTLLLLSIGTFIAARRLRLPYTVLLVLVGLLLIPLSSGPFSFLRTLELTPELLFFVFLPILIFDSAHKINVREIRENLWTISALATVSLLISAVVIACAGYWALRAVGFQVPFIVLLLFGALISATDPVAVLALLQEFGAPKRLSLIFEGESLFNDGTSFALFLVILEVATRGFHGAASVLAGCFSFVTMLAGGALFGLLMGWICSRLLRYAPHEHLQLTITLIAAHLTFLLSELISHHLVIGGLEIRLSSIVATVITAIVIGAHGTFRLKPDMQQYADRFWGYSAFVANSLVFILLGLMFHLLAVSLTYILLPLAVVILVVVIARAVSVYPVIGAINAAGVEEAVPGPWSSLLAWGSLRGALAIMMVLLIPDDFRHPDWRQPVSIKAFITALTIGCIAFTLFVKGTTIQGMLRRLRITDLQELESMEYYEGKVYVYARALLYLLSLREKPCVDQEGLETVRARYAGLYHDACAGLARQARDAEGLFSRVLRMHAIGVEKRTLRGLYADDELSELAYRRVLAKLEHQLSLLEHGRTEDPDFDQLKVGGLWSKGVEAVRRRLAGGGPPGPGEEYLYFRALVIAAHEVVADLTQLSSASELKGFAADAVLTELIDRYQGFETRAIGHANDLLRDHPDLAAEQVSLMEREVVQAQQRSLEELEDSGIISPKVRGLLSEEQQRVGTDAGPARSA